MADEQEIIDVTPVATVYVNIYPLPVPDTVALTVESNGDLDLTREEVLNILRRAVAGMENNDAMPSLLLRVFRPPQ